MERLDVLDPDRSNEFRHRVIAETAPTLLALDEFAIPVATAAAPAKTIPSADSST